MEKNHTSVEHRLYNRFPGDEDVKPRTLRQEIFFLYGKGTSTILFKLTVGMGWGGGPYQLPFASPGIAKLQGIHSRIHVSHLKKAPKAHLDLHMQG